MQITLTIANPAAEDQDLLSLDVYPDMTVETLRSSIQAETRIPPTSQHIYHNGHLVQDDSKTLEQLQIGDGEMLALHVRQVRSAPSRASAAAAAAAAAAAVGRPQPPQQPAGQGRRANPAADPETLRLQLLGDPNARAQMEDSFPQLAAALNDPQRFANLIRQVQDSEQRERDERQRRIAALNADPFDPEAQAQIEEMIRGERVQENLQSAMEHNPEVFGRVHMLYLDVEVNGHKVKALVDSGAQATIMSPSCAEACGIMRLVDKRFAGVAKGVGTANIIGRVHAAPIKIGPLFLACSFTVMEGKSVELLLGLDMLKRFQAVIDLGKDSLRIQGEEVPFLGEADIPRETEEALNLEPTVPGPAGTRIGQRSGAVVTPGEAAGTAAAARATATGAPGRSSSSATTSASAAGGPSSQASATTPAQAPSNFPEADITTLMSLGHTRQSAISALEATGGDVEYAASLLFQQ